MASRWITAILWTLVSVNALTLVLGGLITWLGYAIPMRLKQFGLAPELAQVAGFASLLVACLGLCALNYSSHYALNAYGLSCATFAVLLLFGIPEHWPSGEQRAPQQPQRRDPSTSPSGTGDKPQSSPHNQNSTSPTVVVASNARDSPSAQGPYAADQTGAIILNLLYFALLALLLTLLLFAFTFAHYLRRKEMQEEEASKAQQLSGSAESGSRAGGRAWQPPSHQQRGSGAVCTCGATCANFGPSNGHSFSYAAPPQELQLHRQRPTNDNFTSASANDQTQLCQTLLRAPMQSRQINCCQSVRISDTSLRRRATQGSCLMEEERQQLYQQQRRRFRSYLAVDAAEPDELGSLIMDHERAQTVASTSGTAEPLIEGLAPLVDHGIYRTNSCLSESNLHIQAHKGPAELHVKGESRVAPKELAVEGLELAADEAGGNREPISCECIENKTACDQMSANLAEKQPVNEAGDYAYSGLEFKPFDMRPLECCCHLLASSRNQNNKSSTLAAQSQAHLKSAGHHTDHFQRQLQQCGPNHALATGASKSLYPPQYFCTLPRLNLSSVYAIKSASTGAGSRTSRVHRVQAKRTKPSSGGSVVAAMTAAAAATFLGGVVEPALLGGGAGDVALDGTFDSQFDDEPVMLERDTFVQSHQHH